jgi:site-specific recombinase XerD
MNDLNPANERIKRRYFHYLREADGLAEITIDHAARAIAAFERSTATKDFRSLSLEDAIAWRKKLLSGKGRIAAELSSRATVRSKLQHVQKFVRWLSQQEGFKSRIKVGDADYFDLPRRDRRIASERRNDEAPSLEQVQHVIRSSPAGSAREMRDRALMAFLLLTGARVTATTSFKMCHVLPDKLGIIQDARDVKTKGGRSFKTFFFPVGGDIRQMFLEWIEYLRREMRFGPRDPLFPKSDTMSAAWGDPHQLARQHWKTADPIRKICRRACERAGVPYFPPHTVRRTLTLLGEQLCVSGEQFKAWSQNLGHLKVLTTWLSYGTQTDRRQAAILASMSLDKPTDVLDEIAAILAKRGFKPTEGQGG